MRERSARVVVVAAALDLDFFMASAVHHHVCMQDIIPSCHFILGASGRYGPVHVQHPDFRVMRLFQAWLYTMCHTQHCVPAVDVNNGITPDTQVDVLELTQKMRILGLADTIPRHIPDTTNTDAGHVLYRLNIKAYSKSRVRSYIHTIISHSDRNCR